MLGLSYGGVADLLDSLQVPLAKTTVYRNVQAAGRRATQLRQQWLGRQAGPVPVLGLDFTHVKCGGEDRIVAVATAVLTGQPLTFDLVAAESAVRAKQWIEDWAHLVGAEVVVTDDADGLKTLVDDWGQQQQVCRAHVSRNVHALVGALGTQALERPHAVPRALLGLTVEQFLEDL